MKKWVTNLGKEMERPEWEIIFGWGKECSRKGNELVKRTSKQSISKINLQKYREVPVKGERETIWEC